MFFIAFLTKQYKNEEIKQSEKKKKTIKHSADGISRDKTPARVVPFKRFSLFRNSCDKMYIKIVVEKLSTIINSPKEVRIIFQHYEPITHV